MTKALEYVAAFVYGYIGGLGMGLVIVRYRR